MFTHWLLTIVMLEGAELDVHDWPAKPLEEEGTLVIALFLRHVHLIADLLQIDTNSSRSKLKRKMD